MEYQFMSNQSAQVEPTVDRPAAYIEQYELDQFQGGHSLWTTAWREGGTSPNGQERIAVFTRPDAELARLRSRVAMLEKYEGECLRLVRDAEGERDALKLLNAKFVDLLETSSHFLYDYGRTDAMAAAEEIDAALKEAKTVVAVSEPTDNELLIAHLASKIEGKTVSLDISTGDHDAGNRLFCTIAEVMREGDSFTILAVDPEPNYMHEVNAQPVARVVDFGNKEGWVAQGITLQWCSDVNKEAHVGAKLFANEDAMELLRLQVGTLKLQNRGLMRKRHTLRAQVDELVSAVRSINHGRHHEIRWGGGDEPWYVQRKEWVEWVLELCEGLSPMNSHPVAVTNTKVSNDA
jgi:hypothetical protein